MKVSRIVFGLLLVTVLCGASAVSAAIDPAAAVVLVRTNCTDNGQTLNNCFTSWASLTSWMTNTRKPNATSPLRVEIGPGTFLEDVFITCNAAHNYTGYTAFEGAGSSQTIINGFGSSNTTPLNVSACTEMSFSHLEITTRFYGGVHWDGGGNSVWNDVRVIGTSRAWYEQTCGSTRGNHYWFGSRLTATGAFSIAETYRASCDESWFFGSEIDVSLPANGYPCEGGAVVAFNNGIIHVYGSVLRALIDGPQQSNSPVAAAFAETGGTIHIHGTGIDVTSNTGQNITALFALGGMIHAPAASYFLNTSGTKTRILNAGGMVMAPYLWEESDTPQNIISVNGSDMQVVTNNADGHPHLSVYDSSCASKWFDTVTRACR